jgi:hypothetical protein
VVEGGVASERWRERQRVSQEAVIVGIGDLADGQLKFIDPNAMHGLFGVLPCVAAHEKPSGRDADEFEGAGCFV